MSMSRFVPTDEQRRNVAALQAGGIKTLEQIAKQIISERTHKCISVKTLKEAFPEELREDLRMLTMMHEAIKKALAEGQRWAAEFWGDHTGLRKRDTGPIAAVAKGADVKIMINGVASPLADAPCPGAFDVTPQPTARALSPPHHDGPTIDSREEGFIRPLVVEEEPQYTHTPLRGTPWIGPLNGRRKRQA